MAAAVILRHDAVDPNAAASNARSVWQQLLADATTTQVSAWLAPEVN